MTKNSDKYVMISDPTTEKADVPSVQAVLSRSLIKLSRAKMRNKNSGECLHSPELFVSHFYGAKPLKRASLLASVTARRSTEVCANEKGEA